MNNQLRTYCATRESHRELIAQSEHRVVPAGVNSHQWQVRQVWMLVRQQPRDKRLVNREFGTGCSKGKCCCSVLHRLWASKGSPSLHSTQLAVTATGESQSGQPPPGTQNRARSGHCRWLGALICAVHPRSAAKGD